MDIFDRLKPRRFRKGVFKLFYNSADAAFRAIAASDPRNESLNAFYSFGVAPGGRDGGHDRSLVSIFYGTRPDDTKADIDYSSGYPRVKNRITTESGAQLDYQLIPNGSVMVILYPAKSEFMRRKEDFIVLETIRWPQKLTGRPALESHWKTFIAYMECTCLDGMPTFLQRVEILWLMFTRTIVIGSVPQTPMYLQWAAWVAKWSMMVGMSGGILKLLEVLSIMKTTGQS